MQTHSSSDIHVFCEKIKNSIDRNEQLDNLTELFSKVCLGTDDYCSLTSKLLDSEELLLLILKVSNSAEYLKSKSDLCMKILINLLSHSRKKDWQVVLFLLNLSLESDNKEKNELVKDIWFKKEFYKIPGEIILVLIKYNPLFIEEEFCKICLSLKENNDIWKDSSNTYWIHSCSRSSELFLTLTSILNQFFIYSKNKSGMLKMIGDFISNIISECERSNKIFFCLYPLEYQSLAASMCIEPEINPLRKKVIEQVISLRDKNLNIMLMFLCHFPLWLKLINI